MEKNAKRKTTMQVFINDNARFNIKCLSMIMLDSKKKYFPQTLLEECKYEPKKMKMENLIDDDLEKVCLMSDESGSESDNHSNDETESDDEKDNDESNE